MINVDIWKLRYFRGDKELSRLNHHASIHSTFQLHQIATATGCPMGTAALALNEAVKAGALSESLIFYTHKGEMVMISDTLPTFPHYDDDLDRMFESEKDLVWEPFYIITKQAQHEGWEFVRSK